MNTSPEHLDFMSQGEFPSEMFSQFKQLEHEYIGYQSLTDVPRALTYREEDVDFSSYRSDLPTYKKTSDIVYAPLHYASVQSSARQTLHPCAYG